MHNMNLRSIRVRQIMGHKPSIILRYGTLLIILIFTLLLVVVLIQPLPHGNGETILRYLLKA